MKMRSLVLFLSLAAAACGGPLKYEVPSSARAPGADAKIVAKVQKEQGLTQLEIEAVNLPPPARVSEGATGMFVIPERHTVGLDTTNKVARWQNGINFASATDGLSNTLLVGERNVPQYHLSKKNPSQFDGPGYRGRQDGDFHSRGWSIRRAGIGYPLARSPKVDCGAQSNTGARNLVCGMQFGSYHPAVSQFVLGDASVRGISTTVSETVLQALAHRSDGTVIPDDF